MHSRSSGFPDYILSVSAAMVHVSHTCIQKYGLTRERISLFVFFCCFFLADCYVLVVPSDLKFGHCRCGLVDPGECFGFWSFLRYYSSQAMDGLKFLVVYGNVNADAFRVIYHQLVLLCTDLHAICRRDVIKVICHVGQLLLLSS